MQKFLTVSEIPKSKLQLKKALLNGSIKIHEIDINCEKKYRQLEDVSPIFKIWEGFRFAPKYQNEKSEAYACIGTSFYYKFSK